MKKLTKKENLEDILKQEKLVVVDFYTVWCGPCKQLSPLLETYEKDHPEVLIVKVDCDVCDKAADKYGILSVPTIIAFKKGKKVAQWTGFVSYEEMCRKLRTLYEKKERTSFLSLVMRWWFHGN